LHLRPQCLARKCDKILLDLTVTADNNLVILHKTTLEKSKINEPPETLKYEALQNFNISEHHPLGQHFPPEVIMTLPSLLRTVEDTQSTIYLLAQNNSGKLIDALAKVIEKNRHFMKRFVFCSKSPLAIYKLRKLFPDLVCGLWLPPQVLSKRLNLLYSVYNVAIRNFVAGVTGISVAFIHKDEYNASISKLWANVGIRPIVYFVNSPNEKRYFQQVTKTQYVTDSLRSEPQNILNGKLNYP
jgi:glycerophosphoinositol glycerophosphodiesterase